MWEKKLGQHSTADILRVSRGTVRNWRNGDQEGNSGIPYACFMLLKLKVAFEEQDDEELFALLRKL